MSKTNEIRGGWMHRLGGTVAGMLLWLMASMLRFRIENRSGIDFSTDENLIFALWHEGILTAPWLRNLSLIGRRNTVLTSASKDGTVLSAAASVFGLESARGSSSRRGAAALVALKRALDSGADITVTPDGPRGPRRKVQPGVIKVASVTGKRVVPLRIEYEDAWILRKSWDKMGIPKPGSRVTIVFEKALEVPAKLDEDGMQSHAELLERALSPSANS